MKDNLINGSTSRLLTKMTIPMIIGMFSIMAFRLADTYFISNLGTDELSAISFTFPVIMIIGSISLGLTVGTSSIISMSIGEGNSRHVKRLTTDILILAFFVVILFTFSGIATIKPLFSFLGAPDELIPLIKDYMQIWYAGIIFFIIPMVGNGAIRATGDTKFPGMIMSIAALMNLVLDPLFIFGVSFIPGMGLRGAAIASLISRAIAFGASLYILFVRKKLITTEIPALNELFSSWKNLLYISLPSVGTHLLISVSHAIIIKLLSEYGKEVVAGMGVAARLESFGLLVPMALTSVIGPFVGQNWGAKKINRIDRGIKLSFYFMGIWGVVMIIVFMIFGKNLAVLFSNEPEVVNTIVLYFNYITVSYCFQGIFFISCSVLNALKKPMHTFILKIIRIFVLYLPLAIIGSYLFMAKGIFLALMITNFISGMLAIVMIRRVVPGLRK